MGVVYEAYDPALGRRIALKTISARFVPSEAERDAFEKRFLAEARIAAALSHPGIVTVHDVGRDTETGMLFIALERLEGRTLAQVLKDGPLPDWREALGIVRAIAEALHHAHSRGIVHRDVKPANVMMLPSGRPKIMDLGIARIESSALTAAGEILGTPLYMSPEQARGEKVDGRADLFSLGAIGYALLTGRTAFAAEDTLRVVARVLHDDPPPPSTLVRELPEQVDALIARALAKDVAHRYPDGQALAEDVDDILRGHPPRHSGGGTSRAAHPIDLENELEELVELTDGGPAAPPPAPLVRASPVPPADLRRRPAKRVGGRELTLLAIGALAALAIWYAATRWPLAVGSPVAGLIAPQPPAQLVIDFEHPMRTGLLRVWVDDRPVVEQEVDSRVTNDIAGLKLRKGRLEQALDLEPGFHEVRLEFSWDASVRSERASTTLTSGVARRLEARIGRLRKNLSLEWK